MRVLLVFCLLLCFPIAKAQELNAEVIVDYSQIQNSNVTVYNALQKSLQAFINSTKWTDQKLKEHEKINCSFVIIVNSRPTTNTFQGTLQVYSNRPVFNTSYNTPILNWQDPDFSFEYTLNQQLIFNERQFSNTNLTDVIAYYVYLILGLDADTFALKGGSDYLEKAQSIAINAESQSRFSGWGRIDGLRSRGNMIRNILLKDLEPLRKANYEYHRKGLDLFYNQERQAKRSIYNSIVSLQKYRQQVGQYIALEVFFSAKKDELSKIFSSGEPTGLPIEKLQETLRALVPSYLTQWDKLKG